MRETVIPPSIHPSFNYCAAVNPSHQQVGAGFVYVYGRATYKDKQPLIHSFIWSVKKDWSALSPIGLWEEKVSDVVHK